MSITIWSDLVKVLLEIITAPKATQPATNPLDRRMVLQNRIDGYYGRRRRNWRLKRGLQIAAAVTSFATLVIYKWPFGAVLKRTDTILPIGLFIGMGLLAASFFFRPFDFELEIRQAEDELDFLESEESEESEMEQRAQKLFRLHQLELNKYYDQTLNQSRWIFFAGLVCLLLGFAVIALSVWAIRQGPDDKKYVAAALGGLGGILSNYIGTVYMRMHTETVKSLTEFHNRLVQTHYLHFGNFLLAKIDTKKLREQSLAKVAVNLSTNEKLAPRVGKPDEREKKGKGVHHDKKKESPKED